MVSSKHGARAPTLARHTTSSQSVARVGRVRLFMSGSPIRYLRQTNHPVRTRNGKMAVRDTTNGTRSGICRGRSCRGVPFWTIRRSIYLACTPSSPGRCCDIIFFYSMARKRWDKERKVCSQPVQSVKALEERLCPNGEHWRICNDAPERRSHALYGYLPWLSRVSHTPFYERLVYLSLQQPILPLRCSTVRLGQVPNVVYAALGSVSTGNEAAWLESPPLYRRLSNSPVSVRDSVNPRPLWRSSFAGRGTSISVWPQTASRERGVGWLHGRRSSWSHRRHGQTEVPRPCGQGEESRILREANIEDGNARQTMGPGLVAIFVLRCLRIAQFSATMGALLHPLAILGYEHEASTGYPWSMPFVPPIASRLEVLEDALPSGSPRTPDAAACATGLHAYRCSRHGVWWNIAQHQPSRRSPWTMVRSRRLELGRASKEHYSARIARSTQVTDGLSRKRGSSERNAILAFVYRQPGRSPHCEQHGIRKCKSDARVKTTQSNTRSNGYMHSRGMASVGIKSLCRRAIATLPPRRLADPEAAAAFRRGWDEGADRRIQVPPVRRVTMVRTSSNLQGASSTLENGRGQAVVSTDRPPQRHSAQTGTNESPRNADHTGMAPSTVVPGSCSDGIEGDQVGAASGGSVDRATTRQPILESCSVGSEPRQTRSGTRVNLAMGHRVQTVAGSSRGARAAAILMTEFAWNDITLLSRNSQWQAWLEFCASESRTPLPATEAHFLAFIGWLKVEREAGRRNVGSASIPQYLSAVRQMQVAMTGQAVPSYLLISHALRGYARWEEENFPKQAVRCGIDAVQAHRI